AAAVGEEDQVLGVRSAECGVRSFRSRRQKANGGLDLLILLRVAFELKLRVAGNLSRRKTSDVTVPNRDRLNVLRGAGIGGRQRSTERQRVLNEQPMARRNQCDAAMIGRYPLYDHGEAVRQR